MKLIPRLLALLLVLAAPIYATDDQPDILFILADDLGWSDLGCYGHPWHQTPNLDKLAEEGLRFTDGYSPAPICSASRAGILTGKTPARLHFEFVTKPAGSRQDTAPNRPLQTPPFTLNMELDEVTIPEVLNEVGYETAYLGKWHLNEHYKRYLGWSPTHGPAAQGFQIAEEDFGSHPYSWGKRTQTPITERGVFPQDSMIDRAADLLRKERDQPIFLMVSLFHVHTPVKTRCQWLEEEYAEIIPEDSPARDKRVTYAAFVEEMDHHIGTILDALEASGKKEETLVVFMADNGGHPDYTANGPLRGSKWNLYEGGIRVPFMVRWPGVTTPGSVSETPVMGCDLFPTFASVAGAEAPEGGGHDLTDLLKDPKTDMNRDLLWHFPYYHPEKGFDDSPGEIGVNDFYTSQTRPHSVLRRGKQKLVHFYEGDRSELYDLSEDLSEQTDLSQTQPELADKLETVLKSQLKSMNARFPE